MEIIKKNIKNIVIAILILFGMSKCAQSCNRAGTIDKLEADTEISIHQKDSIIKVLSDSCTVLNTTIKIYQERVSGMQQSLDIQNEAARRISEAKKNISVNVKQSK